jgi:hypothetical protein
MILVWISHLPIKQYSYIYKINIIFAATQEERQGERAGAGAVAQATAAAQPGAQATHQ